MKTVFILLTVICTTNQAVFGQTNLLVGIKNHLGNLVLQKFGRLFEIKQNYVLNALKAKHVVFSRLLALKTQQGAINKQNQAASTTTTTTEFISDFETTEVSKDNIYSTTTEENNEINLEQPIHEIDHSSQPPQEYSVPTEPSEPESPPLLSTPLQPSLEFSPPVKLPETYGPPIQSVPPARQPSQQYGPPIEKYAAEQPTDFSK